ncbi:D-2-hydroxyacid dehydrogenase [Alteromonas hispanica]|uniref:D-2-hydroxyacid dehydrogenase n=1 Tax=Alteromonas hispanica TaxID=315421 RepID=A0A6L9MXF8_9ALTE|nr:D-2-hydroxyacid dehydrogenase [Alteromonas hispanica]NDW22593.1 D-2-hydroxyacid dehydrogenase [Alteromonas hispanica]
MNSSSDGALQITILSKEAKQIASAILDKMGNETKHCPTEFKNLDIVVASNNPEDVNKDNVEVLLADPNLAAKVIPYCHNLKWCQSTWAGNAPLFRLDKTDYQLTGLKGVFGELMREYVFAYLLQFARNIPAFSNNQSKQPPVWQAESRQPLNGLTLGIMGLGNIGQALIPVAHAFGMKVIGMSRSASKVEGTEAMYPTSQLSAFAKRADHVVNLMPDTEQTKNLLSDNFFQHLKPHSIFINAGRGSAVDDRALLDALNNNKLHHAVLDVFRQEPLPPEHAFWHHPKVSITAHTAAESQPEDVAQVFLNNAQRFNNGLPLLYKLDFAKGY